MTKLTLTLVGEDDAAALRVLRRAFADISFVHIGHDTSDIHLHSAGYTGSWDDGNFLCDVARFEPVCGSEDEINRLAEAFTKHVRAYFWDDSVGDTNDDFMLLLERNAEEPDPSICHTHDFCDANILMSNAWEETFPHEPFVPQNTFHSQLWSAAWQQAKAAGFQLPASSLTSRDDHAN